MRTDIQATLGTAPVLPLGRFYMSSATRWSIGMLGLVCVLAVGILLSTWIKDPQRFPVTHVDIQGTLDYIDRDKLKRLVNSRTSAGYHGMNLDKLRDELESLPWIARAHISRIWPGRITVSVDEHEPVARWNDHGLISKKLVVFEPSQLRADNAHYHDWAAVFEPLPVLRGRAGRQHVLLEDFRRYQQALDKHGLQILALIEDERQSLTLQLSKQITVRLGFEKRTERLERFLAVFDQFEASLQNQAVNFDMRYSNGFALGGLDS